MNAGRHYLDASAFAKLLLTEPESPALRAALDGTPASSSDLLVIEATRVARRAGPQALAAAGKALENVDLVPIGEQVRDRAAHVGPRDLRSLDAIHLATADLIRNRIDHLITYDHRLAAAAEALGIRVLAPA